MRTEQAAGGDAPGGLFVLRHVMRYVDAEAV